MDSEAAAQLDIVFTPGGMHLLPVMDRGKTYQPPTHHLENELPMPNPISIAELAISYLETKLAEAIAKFRDKP